MNKVDQNFSETELKVTKLIVEGLTNKEIGERLHLAESTVKKYINKILQRLELRDRTQLAVYAVRNKFDT